MTKRTDMENKVLRINRGNDMKKKKKRKEEGKILQSTQQAPDPVSTLVHQALCPQGRP